MIYIILLLVFAFVSGSTWGIHEKIMHHWNIFHERFPGLNPQFWNPEISWKNKYKKWPENQRRSLVPIFFTDAKHLLASLNQIALFFAGITVAFNTDFILWAYASKIVGAFIVYTIGNWITFKVLYK